MSNTTRVECKTCGWSAEWRDRPSVIHSGWVHTEILKPGHVVEEVKGDD